MLFTNLRVDPDPRGRCSWRQSRQTLPVMRRVNTIAKYMYGPSREFVRFKKEMPTRCIAAECRKTLFEMYQLTTWTYMYFARVFTIRIAGKVCLDWRHKRGRRSQPPKQLYIFFKHINRDKQLLKKIVLLFVSIYSYVWKKTNSISRWL